MIRTLVIFTIVFLSVVVAACGVKEKVGLKGDKEGAPAQQPVAAETSKLGDYVQATQNAAEKEAQSSGVSDGVSKNMLQAPNQPASPRQQIIDAIKTARDKTMEILGITDKPLQELKATLATIKTLCQPTAEDCRKKVQEAREKFNKQMADMNAQAAKARVEKKDVLDKLFEETKNVFMQCEVNASITKGNMKLKPFDHTNGYGGVKVPKKSAVIFFGTGEVPMDFKELDKRIHKGHQDPAALSLHGNQVPDKPLSDACKQSIEKLKAQVTASSK